MTKKERGLLLIQMAKSATDYKDPAALERFLAARTHALTPRAVAAVLVYCAKLKSEQAEAVASGGQQ